MNTKYIIGYASICICFLFSCVSKSNSNQNVTSKSPIDTNADLSIKVSSVENHKYLTVDTLKFLIPKNININSGNVYAGIYEIKGNSIKKHKSLFVDNHVLITTSEDLGQGLRGYLYVFDVRNKSLIRDSMFKRNSLYSSAGVFIIDRGAHMIFSLDKPEWYEAKQENIIPASISYFKGGYFENLKNVYEVGNEVPNDTSLVSFFHKSIAANDKDVVALPNDWWKSNR